MYHDSREQTPPAQASATRASAENSTTTVNEASSQQERDSSKPCGCWKQNKVAKYFGSHHGRELFACMGFAIICAVVELAGIPRGGRTRPLPIQKLENSGEFVRNLSYNEKFGGETVSPPMSFVLSFVLPVVVQLVLASLRWFAKKAVAITDDDVHATICAYMVSMGLTYAVTGVLKRYAGYLRPIFFDMCQPDADYESCTNDNDFETEYIRKSFPSGHASGAFAGLTLLTLYIHKRFGVPSVRVYKIAPLKQQSDADCESQLASSGENESGGNETTVIAGSSKVYYSTTSPPTMQRFVSIVSLLPLSLALFIACSRVVDNKHFPADVVCGSVLGAAIAVFVNSLWFS